MWFFESFQKVCPKSSVLRWEAFEELIRSPKKCTADTEPAVSAPVFGAPYQPYFWQSKFPVFWLLAAVGMIFFEKKGLLISPLGYIKWGPLSSHQVKLLRDSELLRRSVFTTPPLFASLWALLWGERCLQNPRRLCQRRGGRQSESPCVSKSTTHGVVFLVRRGPLGYRSVLLPLDGGKSALVIGF